MSVEPGATTLQRMPNPASSRPRQRTKCATAAFDAAYAAMSIRGTPAALDPTVTITPERRATMRPATARQQCTTPCRFTAKTSCQSAAVDAVNGPVRRIPATVTRMRTGPSSSSIRVTAASTAAASRTSTRYP